MGWQQNQRHRKRQSRDSFASDLIGGVVVVAALSWFAAPSIQSLWTIGTHTPQQVADIERSVYYRNCNAARAAGVAPIMAGSPGYRPEMDGDSDGIACEP